MMYFSAHSIHKKIHKIVHPPGPKSIQLCDSNIYKPFSIQVKDIILQSL